MLGKGRFVWAILAPVVCLLTFAAGSGATPQADRTVQILIRTAKPYDGIAARVQSAGGHVNRRFAYVDAIAADVPESALDGLRSIVGANKISKDSVLIAPHAVERSLGAGRGAAGIYDVDADSASALEADGIESVASQPDSYLLNNTVLNASALLAGGNFGQGVVVAVIDSGIRPGFPHISLDGSVIGGEDFVGDSLGFSNPANNGHGTFVAGMISANAVFIFSPASTFIRSVRIHCPACVTGPLLNQVPMIGTAPLSSIYALRVFGSTGQGSTSTVLAAMERTIDLRQKYEAGEPGGVNIQVANMSLGGATVFAGRDLVDREVDAMLGHDIVVTTSAGNAGPSSLTTGSPASSFGALTVGAASDAYHERIVRDLQFGLGIGALYRPFDGTQTAFFSSRGPDADGRADPDVVANGDWNYGQGFSSPTSINFASGTSFSAPSVAGVAALLERAFPAASARQIRNALILGANPNALTDGSTVLDEGAGMVDAQAAANLLASGAVPDTAPKPNKAKKDVAKNVERGTTLQPLKGTVHGTSGDLKPGQRADFLYEVDSDTSEVKIELGNFAHGSPQNALFGDDIFLTVHSAKTSAIGEGDYKITTFTIGGTFTIQDPEPGLMRVTLNGDTTNASPVSADVAISSTSTKEKGATASGQIRDGQTLTVHVDIPVGVSQAVFEASWKNDWSHFPTSDLDVALVAPDGTVNFDGATLNSPEKVVLTNPAAGTWTVVIQGFSVPSGKDTYRLRVTADGKLIK